MFFAIPLDNKPRWSNPPWMTVLIIAVNMVIYWGPQTSEGNAQERAAAYYVQTVLPALEMPPFLEWLDETHSRFAKQARSIYGNEKALPLLLQLMQQSTPFMRKLRNDEVITADHAEYAAWKNARTAYEGKLPPSFTPRWAQNFDTDTPLRPITLLSATFLHGSAMHLIGNMVFLFLFGFSLELVLGRSLYLIFYLLAGVTGSVLAQWGYDGMGGLGLGASGAVAGLMAMYACYYRLRRIRFFYQIFFTSTMRRPLP